MLPCIVVLLRAGNRYGDPHEDLAEVVGVPRARPQAVFDEALVARLESALLRVRHALDNEPRKPTREGQTVD